MALFADHLVLGHVGRRRDLEQVVKLLNATRKLIKNALVLVHLEWTGERARILSSDSKLGSKKLMFQEISYNFDTKIRSTKVIRNTLYPQRDIFR